MSVLEGDDALKSDNALAHRREEECGIAEPRHERDETEARERWTSRLQSRSSAVLHALRSYVRSRTKEDVVQTSASNGCSPSFEKSLHREGSLGGCCTNSWGQTQHMSLLP